MKRRSKISSTQRDRAVIDAAKYLKKIGALSPRTKLHGGKFVSPKVLARVRELAYVEKKHYTTVKAPRAVAEKAKAAGYQVVRGNYIVTPRDRRYRESIARGEPSGVVPTRSGVVEVIELPHDIIDMQTLVGRLEDGDLMEDLIAPGEMFAFKFFGHDSYQPFPNSREFLDYLRHYKSVFSPTGQVKTEDLSEEFKNLVLIRMNPGDYNPPTPEQRRKIARAKGSQSRRSKPRYNQPRSEMLNAKANRLREDDRERKQRERADLKASDASGYLLQLERERARVKRYRTAKKSKSK